MVSMGPLGEADGTMELSWTLPCALPLSGSNLDTCTVINHNCEHNSS